MRKVIFLLLFAALFFVVGCSETESSKEQNDEQATKDVSEVVQDDKEETNDEKEKDETNSEDPLENIVTHFKNNSFDIGERAFKAYEMVGAIDGFGIEVNGKEIELYLYESDSEDLEQIISTGEYDMDGFVFPAKVNGNIVIINHNEHPEEEKIIEAFESY